MFGQVRVPMAATVLLRIPVTIPLAWVHQAPRPRYPCSPVSVRAVCRARSSGGRGRGGEPARYGPSRRQSRRRCDRGPGRGTERCSDSGRATGGPGRRAAAARQARRSRRRTRLRRPSLGFRSAIDMTEEASPIDDAAAVLFVRTGRAAVHGRPPFIRLYNYRPDRRNPRPSIGRRAARMRLERLSRWQCWPCDQRHSRREARPQA